MPVLCVFLMCDDVRVVSGKYSLEGIFYRIHAPVFPCVYDCYVVLGWYGEGGVHSFRLKFLASREERVLLELPDCTFFLSPEQPYYNALMQVRLPLEEEGVYRFEVILNNCPAGSFPVFVEAVPGVLKVGH